MATFLFDEIIFGPVKSRRLGVSLGINLLPVSKKICNYNCVYCECGLTDDTRTVMGKLPARKEVYKALDQKLSDMKTSGEKPDVLTYAGNGEPTLHPDFADIIDDSIKLRNKYFPSAKIAVLSNATTLTDSKIRMALNKIDQNIQKLDSAIASTIKLHNSPNGNTDVESLIRNLAEFNGKVIIQTLFLRGEVDGKKIDNTTPDEISEWIKALKIINPSEVMIYTISRDTPQGSNLKKVSEKELRAIAEMVEKVGFRTQVSG